MDIYIYIWIDRWKSPVYSVKFKPYFPIKSTSCRNNIIKLKARSMTFSVDAYGTVLNKT